MVREGRRGVVREERRGVMREGRRVAILLYLYRDCNRLANRIAQNEMYKSLIHLVSGYLYTWSLGYNK